jgi:uncharacterized membrane protein
MHHRHFYEQLDESRITEALSAARRATSAEIRVFISHHHVTDALAAAHNQFHLMGLDRDPQRHGVLIFIAPRARQFAIYADEAANHSCGPQFWHTVRDEVIPQLKSGDFTAAILHAVDRVAARLSKHFQAGGPKI